MGEFKRVLGQFGRNWVNWESFGQVWGCLGEFGRVLVEFWRKWESLGEFWASLGEFGRVWASFRRVLESLVEFGRGWES